MMSNYKANPFSPALSLTPNRFICQRWTYPSTSLPPQSQSYNYMRSPVFFQPGVPLPLSPHFKQYTPNAQCLSSTPGSLCSSEDSSPGVSKDSGPPFDFPSHSHLYSDHHSMTLHHIPDYLKRGMADELVLQKAVEGAAKNGVILEVPDSSLKIDFRFRIDSPEFIPKRFQPLVPCADTISDANSSKLAHKECLANEDNVVTISHEESLGKFRQEASPLNRSEEIDSGIGFNPLAETICYGTQTDHFEQENKETQTALNIIHKASQTQGRSDQEERNYGHVVGVAPLYNYSEINRTVCNLQMEICQLRASICLNELHRQLCQLKLDKYNWTTHFTPIKDQKSAGFLSFFNSRYKCLLEETTRIETQLSQCLEVLENGNVLKELPDFGIFMPDNTMFIPLVTRRPNYSTVEESNEIYSSSSGKHVYECKNFAEKTCKLSSNSPNQSTKCIPHASVGCQENVEMLLKVMDGQDNVSSQGTTNADFIKCPQIELDSKVHMAMISVSQMSLHDEALNLEIDKPVDVMSRDGDTEKVAEISCHEPNNQIKKNTSYDQPIVEKNEHQVKKTDTFFDRPVIDETEGDQYQTETFDQLLLLEKDPYLKQNAMSSDHLGLGENEEFDEKRTLFDHCLPMESDCSQNGTFFEVPVSDKSSQHQMLTDFVIVGNDHLQRLQDISDAKDGELKTLAFSSLPETSSSENNETLDLNKSISSASLSHSNQIAFNCNTLLSGLRSDNLKVNIDPQNSSLSNNKNEIFLTSTCQETNQENNLHVCKSTDGYLDKTELRIIKSTLSHTVNCSLEIYSEDGHNLMRNDFQEMTPSTLEKFDKMSLKSNKGNIDSPKICQQQVLVSSVESPEEPNHESYEVSIGKQETDDVLDVPGREWDDKEFDENISSMSAIEPESDDDSQLVCLNNSAQKTAENSLNENCVSVSNPINVPTTNIPVPSFSLVKETPSIVLDTSSTIETFGNKTATKKPSSSKEPTSTLQSAGEVSQLPVHNLVTQLPCSEGNWISSGVSQMSTPPEMPLISQRFSPVCHLHPESPSVKNVPLLQNEIEQDEIYQEVLKTLQETYPLFALDPDFLLKLAWEQTQILKLHLNSCTVQSLPISTDVPAKMDTFGNQLIPDAIMKPSAADNLGVFSLTNFATPLMDFGCTVTVPDQTSGVNLMGQDIVFGRNKTGETAGKDHKMSTLTKSNITTSTVGNVLMESLNADEINSDRASSLKSLQEIYKTGANETFSREAKLLASKAEANATAPSTHYKNAPQPPLVSGIAMQTSWSKWHDPPGLSKIQVPCLSSKNTVSDLDLTNTFSSAIPNSQTRLIPQPLKPLVSIHRTVNHPAASASLTTTAPVSISHPSDSQDKLDKGCTKEPQSEDWMKVGKKGKTKLLKGKIQQAVPGISDRRQLQKVQPTDPLSADKEGQPRKGKVNQSVSYTTFGGEKTEEHDCKKVSPFQKLVRTLMKNFPSIKLEDVIKTVEEVKQQHGKFTGMMFSDVVQAVHRVILQKYGLRPKPQVSPVFTDMSVQAKEKMPPLVKNSSTPWHISSQQSCSSNVYTRQLTSRECSICLANIVPKNRQQLDCGHTFHSVCISKWLSKHNRTCPNCRKLALMPDEFPHLSK